VGSLDAQREKIIVVWRAKKAESHRVKYWEIIADNLSKAGFSWAVLQPWIATGERSGLLMRIAMTESVSLCVPRKS
jgi:hypothetical protein